MRWASLLATLWLVAFLVACSEPDGGARHAHLDARPRDTTTEHSSATTRGARDSVAEEHRPLEVGTPVTSAKGQALCLQAIWNHRSFPPTVAFETVRGFSTHLAGDGTRDVQQSVLVRAASGRRVWYTADCRISPDGAVSITLAESRP